MIARQTTAAKLIKACRALAAAALAGIGVLIGGVWISDRVGNPPLENPRSSDLIPEEIPFISDRERGVIRAEYLPAPAHKALAIGNQAGFVTGQKDIDSAKAAALAACQEGARRDWRKCELYAIGNKVVFAAGRPPLPLSHGFRQRGIRELPTMPSVADACSFYFLFFGPLFFAPLFLGSMGSSG
jgi:hypothetical protein